MLRPHSARDRCSEGPVRHCLESEATPAETNTPSPSVGVGSIRVNGLIQGGRRGASAIWLITFVLAFGGD